MDAFELFYFLILVILLLEVIDKLRDIEAEMRKIEREIEMREYYEADEDEYSGAVIPAKHPIDAGHNIDGRILDVSDSRPVSNRLMQERDY